MSDGREQGNEIPYQPWWNDEVAIAEHERLRQQFKREQEAFNTEMWELSESISAITRKPMSQRP